MKSTTGGARTIAACGAVAAAALLAACGRSDISEKPVPIGSDGPPTFQTAPSTIGAMVTVPLAQVVQAVNKAVPRSYSQGWTAGPDECKWILGVHVCVGTQYKFDVSRGDIAITPQGTEGVNVSVPISLSGQGGFRGTGAEILKLDAKNFEAAAVFDVGIVPKVEGDWCPRLNISPSYRWTRSPTVEIVSGVNVGISGQVEDPLNKKFPDLVKAVTDSIDCAQIKAKMAEIYGTRTFPVELTPSQKLYVNVEPTDIGLSNLQVDATAIRLSALLNAKVEVSGQPLHAALIPLPPLKKLGAGTTPRMNVAVPLRAPYSAMKSVAKEYLVGKTFEQDTRAGKVKLKVGDVTVYPAAGGKVAAGIDFDADMPGKVLNTKGIVYVTGVPTVQGQQVVSLKDVGFTRVLDNDLWILLSVLLESQIKTQIESKLRYDMGPEIATAKTKLAKKLADPAAIPNVKVSATDVQMGVGRIAAGAKDLAIEALFQATVTVEPNVGALVTQR